MESSWLQDAVEGKKKKVARLQKKKERKERRERIKGEHEREKDQREKERSDRFPSRVEIKEHEDGIELIIKPYPFGRLFLKFIRPSLFACIIGGLASPIMIWVLLFWGIFSYLDGLDMARGPVLAMKILWFPVAYGLLCSVIIGIRALRYSVKNHRLALRFAEKGYYALYKTDPAEPFSVGTKNNLSIILRMGSNDIPVECDIKSPYWGSIEIGAPDSGYTHCRQALPAKDIHEIRQLLKDQGVKWKEQND